MLPIIVAAVLSLATIGFLIWFWARTPSNLTKWFGSYIRLFRRSNRHSYPLHKACSPVRVRRGESGLLPDRTQGAGLSRRLAGEVYGLA